MADGVEGLLQQTPKKRFRNPTEWKREKRKRLRIAGQEYVNSRGDIVQARAIGDDCKCRRKCYVKVPEQSRNQLFDGYYCLKSHDEQNAYLYGLIRKHDIARKRSKNSDRRTCTYKYYVRIKGKEVQVCRLAFAHIHGISPHKIRILCQKLDQNVMFPRDGRGKHDNRPKKISPETMEHIKQHIYSIIKSDKVKDFIKEEKNNGPDVNITKMWKDYLQKNDPNFHLYTSHGRSKNRLWVDQADASENPGTSAYKELSFDSSTLDLSHLHDSTSTSSSDFDPKEKTSQGTSKRKKPVLEPLVKHWLYSKVFHEEFKFHDFIVLKKKLWDIKAGKAQAVKSERKQKSPKKILRDKQTASAAATEALGEASDMAMENSASAIQMPNPTLNPNDVYIVPMNLEDLNHTLGALPNPASINSSLALQNFSQNSCGTAINVHSVAQNICTGVVNLSNVHAVNVSVSEATNAFAYYPQ